MEPKIDQKISRIKKLVLLNVAIWSLFITLAFGSTLLMDLGKKCFGEFYKVQLEPIQKTIDAIVNITKDFYGTAEPKHTFDTVEITEDDQIGYLIRDAVTSIKGSLIALRDIKPKVLPDNKATQPKKHIISGEGIAVIEAGDSDAEFSPGDEKKGTDITVIEAPFHTSEESSVDAVPAEENADAEKSAAHPENSSDTDNTFPGIYIPSPSGGGSGGDGSDAEDKPHAPIALKMKAEGNISLEIAWSIEKDADVKKICIYRRDASLLSFVKIAECGTTNIGYIDKNVTEGRVYYYAVTAISADGKESDFSNEVYGITGIPENERVLVLVNNAAPGSAEVGEYYKLAREVPDENILALSISETGEIDSYSYATEIETPLRNYLDITKDKNGLPLKDKILFIATVYGVPYKYRDGNGEISSVDAKLEGVFGEYPEFDSTARFTTDKPGYIVSRLDGQSVETVKGIIDRTLYAEKHLDLGAGNAYFDKFNNAGTVYTPVEESANIAKYQKLPYGTRKLSVVKLQVSPLKNDFQAKDCKGAVLYYGWQDGYSREVFDWKAGAIGCAIGSSEVLDLRVKPGLLGKSETKTAWLSGAIADNITAAIGFVKYVEGEDPFRDFIKPFFEGYNFAEASELASKNPNLIRIGDPIYNLTRTAYTKPLPNLPKISDIKASMDVENHTITFTWKTDVPSCSYLELGENSEYETSNGDKIVLEDGGDDAPEHWEAFNGGHVITTIDEGIKLSGNGINSSYKLEMGSQDFKYTGNWLIGFKFKADTLLPPAERDFRIVVTCNTTASDSSGFRHLRYTTEDPQGSSSGATVVNYMADGVEDGEWHNILVDLERDLHEVDPGTDIVSIDFITVVGNLSVDSILLFKPAGAMAKEHTVTLPISDMGIDLFNLSDGNLYYRIAVKGPEGKELFSDRQTFALKLGSVSGRVTLEDKPDDFDYAETEATFFIRKPGDIGHMYDCLNPLNDKKTDEYGAQVMLDSLGNYTLFGIFPGSYEIAVKTKNSLMEAKRVILTEEGSDLKNIDFGPLLLGDVTGNNVIDLLDEETWRDAWRDFVHGGIYDANADLNGDGIIDEEDLAILLANKGKEGYGGELALPPKIYISTVLVNGQERTGDIITVNEKDAVSISVRAKDANIRDDLKLSLENPDMLGITAVFNYVYNQNGTAEGTLTWTPTWQQGNGSGEVGSNTYNLVFAARDGVLDPVQKALTVVVNDIYDPIEVKSAVLNDTALTVDESSGMPIVRGSTSVAEEEGVTLVVVIDAYKDPAGSEAATEIICKWPQLEGTKNSKLIREVNDSMATVKRYTFTFTWRPGLSAAIGGNSTVYPLDFIFYTERTTSGGETEVMETLPTWKISVGVTDVVIAPEIVIGLRLTSEKEMELKDQTSGMREGSIQAIALKGNYLFAASMMSGGGTTEAADSSITSYPDLLVFDKTNPKNPVHLPEKDVFAIPPPPSEWEIETWGGLVDWTNGHAYAVGNVVQHNGQYYHCEAPAWSLSGAYQTGATGATVQNKGSIYRYKKVKNWAAGTSYKATDVVVKEGDEIYYYGMYYYCTADHTSTEDTHPPLGQRWKSYWSSFLPSWEAGTIYVYDSKVESNGSYYKWKIQSISSFISTSTYNRGPNVIKNRINNKVDVYFRCIAYNANYAYWYPGREPGVGTNWTRYWEMLGSFWQSGGLYSEGSIVVNKNRGGYYRCISVPPTSDSSTEPGGTGSWTGYWVAINPLTDDKCVQPGAGVCWQWFWDLWPTYEFMPNTEPGIGANWTYFWTTVNLTSNGDTEPGAGGDWKAVWKVFEYSYQAWSMELRDNYLYLLRGYKDYAAGALELVVLNIKPLLDGTGNITVEQIHIIHDSQSQYSTKGAKLNNGFIFSCEFTWNDWYNRMNNFSIVDARNPADIKEVMSNYSGDGWSSSYLQDGAIKDDKAYVVLDNKLNIFQMEDFEINPEVLYNMMVPTSEYTISRSANIGSPHVPLFMSPVDCITQNNYYYPTPAMCDIDGDGDYDMFVSIYGVDTGNIDFYRNEGNVEDDNFTNPPESGYAGIKLPGEWPSLTFCDIDGDGDQDMFAGEDNGTITFVENTTNPTPDMLPPYNVTWGPVQKYEEGVKDANGVTINGGYYPVPAFCDIDGDGDQDMFIGGDVPGVMYYRNYQSIKEENSPTPLFSYDSKCIDANGAEIGSGNYSNNGNMLSFCDIDGDGDQDMFISTYEYTVMFVENTTNPTPDMLPPYNVTWGVPKNNYFNIPTNGWTSLAFYPSGSKATIKPSPISIPEKYDDVVNSAAKVYIGEETADGNYYMYILRTTDNEHPPKLDMYKVQYDMLTPIFTKIASYTPADDLDGNGQPIGVADMTDMFIDGEIIYVRVNGSAHDKHGIITLNQREALEGVENAKIWRNDDLRIKDDWRFAQEKADPYSALCFDKENMFIYGARTQLYRAPHCEYLDTIRVGLRKESPFPTDPTSGEFDVSYTFKWNDSIKILTDVYDRDNGPVVPLRVQVLEKPVGMYDKFDPVTGILSITGNLLPEGEHLITISAYDGKSTTPQPVSIKILSYPAPVADFTADITGDSAPVTVIFTYPEKYFNVSLTKWEWNFYDGTTSTEQNPSHVYSAPGKYDVSLTVTGRGGSDTETKEDYITVAYPLPVADFTADTTSIREGLPVTFTDKSSQYGGEITSWAWDFGDNIISEQQSPTHNYYTPGTYDVSLTVTGPGGSVTKTKENYITVSYRPPVADFEGLPRDGVVPLTVQFTDKSIGQVSNRIWLFGDGSISPEQKPSHTYNTPGIYAVTLAVNGLGGVDSEIKAGYINVAYPPPVANFTVSPVTGDVPLSVTLTSTSTGVITSYLWDFGDSTTSTERSLSHIYNILGTFNVTLTVTGPGGTDKKEMINCISVVFGGKINKAYSGAETIPVNEPLVLHAELTANDFTSYSWLCDSDEFAGGTVSEGAGETITLTDSINMEEHASVFTPGIHEIQLKAANDNLDVTLSSEPFTITVLAVRDSSVIQAALNAAPIGGTVMIDPGVYVFSSDLLIKRNVTIKALDPNPDHTIFKLGNYRIFIKDGQFYNQNEVYYQLLKYLNNVVIDGVTIRGYRGTHTEGAIQNYSGGLTLRNCKIIDNQGIRVSAIYSCWMSKLYLENTLIAKNRTLPATSVSPYTWRYFTQVWAGTIYAGGYTTFNAVNTTIADNINDSQSFTITGSAGYDGTTGPVTITVEYGAVMRRYQETLTMKNCITWNNGRNIQDFNEKDFREQGLSITYSDTQTLSIFLTLYGYTAEYRALYPNEYTADWYNRIYYQLDGTHYDINQDPQFVDSVNGNYNIKATSPCKGRGENGADMGAKFE